MTYPEGQVKRVEEIKGGPFSQRVEYHYEIGSFRTGQSTGRIQELDDRIAAQGGE